MNRLLRYSAFVLFVLACGERVLISHSAGGAAVAAGLACWVMATVIEQRR
jgi:hypothetical protein